MSRANPTPSKFSARQRVPSNAKALAAPASRARSLTSSA
jgi:hypothetical protein